MSSNLASPTKETENNMLLKKRGALTIQRIKDLYAYGCIKSENTFDEGQIQPASLDLRLSKRCWQISASFLPGKNKTVNQKLSILSTKEIDIEEGKLLKRGCIYIVELQEKLELPKELSCIANAKSSTGRLDILTRLITDNSNCFDRIFSGYKGKLYVEIAPISFSIIIKSGITLNQLRFHYNQNILSDVELNTLNQKTSIVEEKSQIDNGVTISVDLRVRGSKPAGYKAKKGAPPVNLSKLNYHNVADYWDRVITTDGSMILEPGAFYILRSREYIVIPPHLAAEMVPYEVKMGEFRVHYAGFFDPGFGAQMTSEKEKSKAVLEIRCHETPFILEDKQVIGKLIYETLTEVPIEVYGKKIRSNYQGQDLKLSKHFTC